MSPSGSGSSCSGVGPRPVRWRKNSLISSEPPYLACETLQSRKFCATCSHCQRPFEWKDQVCLLSFKIFSILKCTCLTLLQHVFIFANSSISRFIHERNFLKRQSNSAMCAVLAATVPRCIVMLVAVTTTRPPVTPCSAPASTWRKRPMGT